MRTSAPFHHGRRAAWLLLILAIPGCGFRDPKYEVGDRKMLVVPFRDLSVRYGHGYGESPRGQKVVEAMINFADQIISPNFTDPASTAQVVRELREWSRGDITAKDWKRLLSGVDADLVLIGEINEFRTRDPRTIGLLQGMIAGRYNLIDPRTGRSVYKSTEVKLTYPPEKEMTVVIPEIGGDVEGIEKGLIKTFGERVAKDLFGYYEDE